MDRRWAKGVEESFCNFQAKPNAARICGDKNCSEGISSPTEAHSCADKVSLLPVAENAEQTNWMMTDRLWIIISSSKLLTNVLNDDWYLFTYDDDDEWQIWTQELK